MGSVVKCPRCNQRINIPPQLAGQEFLCPMCKTQLPANVATDAVSQRRPSPVSPTRQNPAHEFSRSDVRAVSQASVQSPRYGATNENTSAGPVFWIFAMLAGGCLVVVSLVVVGLMLVRVQRANDNGENAGKNLLQARTGFETKLTSIQRDEIAIPQPPAELFEVIQYDAPLGKNWAYLGKPENDSIKHPAIIWKFGGFSNRIGTTAWEAQPIRNDQSASAFRRRGVVMMYPSLRGGNGNPGQLEGLYGEVDDILAAADYLANQDFVDPNRIYLGGHSTGGTLVLLCAASSDQFRAVFSFGPVDDISGYGQDSLPFDISNANELLLRNPVNWIHAIKTPTFLFEGAYGNAESLHAMQQSNRNSNLHFYTIADKDHFEVLEPVTNLLAKKVVRDTARDCNIAITEEEIKTAFAE